MAETSHTLSTLFAACWKDSTLKERFMSDPKVVLAEYGLAVPEGMDVTVVDSTDSNLHIFLPAPPEGHHDLSDDELAAAAGGTDPAYLAQTTIVTSIGPVR